MPEAMKPGPFRFVVRVLTGPVKQRANGTTGPAWTRLDLSCGHFVTRQTSQLGKAKRARCPKCIKGE